MIVIQQTQKIIVAALSLFYYCETSESEKQGNLFWLFCFFIWNVFNQ